VIGSYWIDAARLEELPPGGIKRVEVAGQVLALVNVEGTIHALSAVCPHQGGPLDEGTVWDGKLECPWHHFLFDLRTGLNVYPANVYPADLAQLRPQLAPLQMYPVRIEDGRVLVNIDALAPG